MVSLRVFVSIALAVAAVPAGARTFCCTDDRGHRVCGEPLPVECQKRAYNELNSQGVLSKRYEAPLTPEQRAQRDAELARKKAEEQAAAEQARRDRVLLGRYNSVADIDARRARMVGDAANNVALAQERVDAATARQQKLQQEMGAYRDKKVPDGLTATMRATEAQLAARQATLDERRRDLQNIETTFTEERKRFLELTAPRPETR